MMEINSKTTDMLNQLTNIYQDWEILSQIVKPLEYQIVRDNRDILLKTNAITFVVQKMKS